MVHVPYICLAYAFLLVYVPRFGPVAAAMSAQPGGYNNNDPRTQQQALEGRARRAHNAHLNGFEAFAPFAAAVLMAQAAGVDHARIAQLAIAFVVLRVLHGLFYVTGMHLLRSAAWGGALACVVWLMVQAAQHIA